MWIVTFLLRFTISNYKRPPSVEFAKKDYGSDDGNSKNSGYDKKDSASDNRNAKKDSDDDYAKKDSSNDNGNVKNDSDNGSGKKHHEESELLE